MCWVLYKWKEDINALKDRLWIHFVVIQKFVQKLF